MSRCRRMQHEDTGAPALYAYQRTGLFSWLDAVMTVGYNQKYITNYSRSGRNVTFTYAAAHGYLRGQLLKITGATYTALNGLLRVIDVPSTTQLTIYLDDNNFANYPEAATETTLQTIVAPFGWEKLYESATQRSYRSTATDSSKVVFTVRTPTRFHATQLVTTNAVCYEVDFSKNLDLTTGSSIDSCFSTNISATGHTNFYWVTSTNSDVLSSSMNYTNTSTARAPWTLVGDERFVYVITCPYTTYDNSENSNDRQFNPNSYWNGYRYWKCWAFGDINAVDTAEYNSGSSFYFNFYYFRSSSSYAGNITNIPTYNSFIRAGSYSWYDYFFSGYDPNGSYQGAKIQTTTSSGGGSYGTNSGSRSQYIGYPQRVMGGVTYFDYLCYAYGPSVGVNTLTTFYKGTFPYVKYSDTNFSNIGSYYDLRSFTLPLNSGSKIFYSQTNHDAYWGNWSEYGAWCFELD